VPASGCPYPLIERTWHDADVGCLVLIVDDDSAFLTLAEGILARLGLEVGATAPDAARALDIARDVRPDAMLVDVGLPDRDGIDLAHELAELPWAPLVVLTSSDSEVSVAAEARNEHGRIPFIAKTELAGDELRRAFSPCLGLGPS
jgi:CheY-like chemotaxis protein